MESPENKRRNSLTDSSSLSDPPTPPSRTSKRVSFSDDLPIQSAKQTTQEQEIAEEQPFCLPIEHVLQRASNYLENLHRMQNHEPATKDEVDQHPKGSLSSPPFPHPRRVSIPVDDTGKDFSWPESPGNEAPTLPSSETASNNSISLDIEPIVENRLVSPEPPEVPNRVIREIPEETHRLNRQKINDENCSFMELEVKREKLRWLLISECSVFLGEGKHTREGIGKVFAQQEFLQNFFRLFDLDGYGFLAHDKWVELIKGRLTEDKQIDFAEQLESVAYVICGDSKITYKEFYQIWNAPGILDKLYRLIDVDATNQISTNQITEFVANLTNSRARTGFDKSSLERLEILFRRTVGNEKEIRREEFKKIVISKNPFFTERVFQIFDNDNSGTISLQEFIDAMHQFAGQSAEDKIKFLFKVYDIDGDGLIQHLELQHVIRACMEENGMQFSEDQVDDLTMAMFEDADPFNRGAITYEALKGQLEKHGGLLENLSISIDRWLVPAVEEPPKKKRSLMPHQFSPAYMRNNYDFLFYLAAFFIVNISLFISRAIQYRESNGFVILARACGQCLNFNCAWVLVMMLRQSITYLRTRGFSSILPLDHHIYLHKLTGIMIAIYSLVHTIMHLFNFCLLVVNDPVVNAKNYTIGEWLFTSRPGLFGLVPGCANPTGIALFVILLIMFICSQPFVRRKGSFEVFYWTHLLYIPFWILVIFHGPNFWKWFIIPGLIFAVERILRIIWMRTQYGKTYISSGLLLPSRVTHLVIKRPTHFSFRPGDYVFVNIPAIAKYEWHPFTLSSAPEQEDYMWLHIRGVGEWTNSLYSYFEREHERLHNGEIPPHRPSIQNSATQKNPAPQSEFKGKNIVRMTHSTSFDSHLVKLNGSDGKISDSQSNPIVPQRPPRHNPGTSKLAIDGYTASKANERQSSDNRAIKNIKASLQRTFSRKDNTEKNAGFSNDAFLPDESDPGSNSDPKRKLTPESKLPLMLLGKAPLEKSLSMPDIQTRTKNRKRLMALREYARSESERTFDEGQMRKARHRTLGMAYLSPQNKSLAQSFRYMRNKPTIIAFKTPSLENCEPRASSQSMIVSPGMYTQKEAEEGKIIRKETDATPSTSTQRGINYPVGKPLEIYIDGPYGAPSSHIFGAQHAVLIATGIGVTPFASILQSIMHRYWKARHSCPRCQFEWASDIPKAVMNLRKVDFFWINRDQRSFEWFVNLLSQLEIEQAELGGALERFLDMHMYITSALQKTDMKAVGLQLALDLLHEKEKRDLITGLKTRTNAGRPNWDKVFKQITAQKKGKVTVFYCGPPQLAKTLRYKCDQYGFSFRKEIF